MENFPHLPTLLSVAAAVVVLTFLLNRLLFIPLQRILDERKRRADEARGDLDAAQSKQAERLDEIERRLSAARREAYEVREAAQREGRARRDELLGEARGEAQQIVDAARGAIAADLQTARQDLEAEADRLSRMITERVLGRPVGSGRSDE